MADNKDYRDLLKCFDDEKVDYLIVGAFAVAFYAESEFTKDFEVWVRPSEMNAVRTWRALGIFGAPLQDITPANLADPKMVYPIGIPPNRIDIISNIEGVDFEGAWKNRMENAYMDVPIHIIGKDDLIRNKQALNRPEDQFDLERLK